MVRTPHTRATEVQEVTLAPGATLGLATTLAMAPLRAPRVLPRATLVTRARPTPPVGLRQAGPRPPSTPCCRTEARGSLAAMKGGRPPDQVHLLGALGEATLAGDIQLTRTTEDR